ncbi:hypothetical protein LCGC14_2966660 [marine sediment metagenome]|uniref:Uncharacterized protein n=1 Tax=marine sediment metagenome TaxID=412755 RepID=A0A0F8XY05_9ZZZZ
MEFLTGKDYPHLCKGCQSIVDQTVEAVLIGPDTDDNEAPLMLAYDLGLLCGGHNCICDCCGDEYDILCPAHGGTAVEKTAFNIAWCDKYGHPVPPGLAGRCPECQREIKEPAAVS